MYLNIIFAVLLLFPLHTERGFPRSNPKQLDNGDSDDVAGDQIMREPNPSAGPGSFDVISTEVPGATLAVANGLNDHGDAVES